MTDRLFKQIVVGHLIASWFEREDGSIRVIMSGGAVDGVEQIFATMAEADAFAHECLNCTKARE